MAERTEVLSPETISLRMIEYGVELARDVGATAMLICAEVSLPRVTIRAALGGMPFRVIMASATIREAMVKPSPVPPNLRVVERSSCSKARKMRSCCSRGMPMPVSLTVSGSTSSARCVRPAGSWAGPRGPRRASG